MGLFQKIRITNIISRERINEKGMFLKRIGALLEEGYSLKDALKFLKKMEKGESLKWIKTIQKGLLKGYSFHHQLEELDFSSKVCAQIYLGSQTENYGRIISKCGEQLLERVEKEKKFKSLATYPIVLLLFLVGMMLLMRFMVLPHMETLLSTTGSNSTIYSNGLVWLVYYSPQILLSSISLAVICWVSSRQYFKNKSVFEKVTLLSKVPFLSRYLKDYYTNFFFTEWGNLFQNGYSFQEIVTLMKGDQASPLLRESGDILAEEMKLGKTIPESLVNFPFIHPEGREIVTHGENLGKLSTEMLVYADFCENELNQRVEKIMASLQPIIFVFVALVIVAIYGALMLPVFSIMEGF